MLYAINQSHARSDLRLIDVSDPTTPRELGRFLPDTGGTVFEGGHDVHVVERDGRLIAYLNSLWSGFYVLDVTDPGAIAVLAREQLPGTSSHSGWAFAVDGRDYYLHADEGHDQQVTLFDVTDPDAPRRSCASAPAPASPSTTSRSSMASPTSRTTPTDCACWTCAIPTPRSRWRTLTPVPAEQERDLTQGAWGVHVDGGRVYVSDREHGVFALEVTLPD